MGELSEHNSELEQSREELSATLHEKRGGKNELRSSYELKRIQTIDEVEERIAYRLEEIRVETEETAFAYRRQTEEVSACLCLVSYPSNISSVHLVSVGLQGSSTLPERRARVMRRIGRQSRDRGGVRVGETGGYEQEVPDLGASAHGDGEEGWQRGDLS